MLKNRKLMRTRYFGALLVLLTLMLSASSRSIAEVANINSEDGLLSITMGQHQLTAEQGLDTSASFLIMGAFTPDSDAMRFFTASLLAIPQADAEVLINRFGGDVHRCKTEGSALAKGLSRPVTFIAENILVEQKIQDVVRMANGDQWPMVEIRGKELNVVAHNYGNARFNMSGMGSYYLVSDISLLE